MVSSFQQVSASKGAIMSVEGCSRNWMLFVALVLLSLFDLQCWKASSAPSQLSASAVRLRPPSSPSSPILKNLVMTIARGSDFNGVYRFVSTLRAHVDNVDIVVFTDEPSIENNPQLKVMYDLFDVTLVYVSADSLPKLAQGFTPTGQRHFLYRDWMRSHSEAVALSKARPYGMVLFCDSRDMYFQADPFLRLTQSDDFGGGKGFYAFYESHDSIGGSEWNWKWVYDCFGEGLRKVEREVVVCCGTSMGSWDDAFIYEEMMGGFLLFLAFAATPSSHTDTLLSLPITAGIILNKSSCERNGSDQGVHNYIVHGGDLEAKVSALYKVPNEEGVIMNAGIMRAVERDPSGRILTLSGKVAASVHQYDRFPDLARQIEGSHVWLQKDQLRAEHG